MTKHFLWIAATSVLLFGCVDGDPCSDPEAIEAVSNMQCGGACLVPRCESDFTITEKGGINVNVSDQQGTFDGEVSLDGKYTVVCEASNPPPESVPDDCVPYATECIEGGIVQWSLDCPDPDPPCGNGVCEDGETSESCPVDCGDCGSGCDEDPCVAGSSRCKDNVVQTCGPYNRYVDSQTCQDDERCDVGDDNVARCVEQVVPGAEILDACDPDQPTCETGLKCFVADGEEVGTCVPDTAVCVSAGRWENVGPTGGQAHWLHDTTIELSYSYCFLQGWPIPNSQYFEQTSEYSGLSAGETAVDDRPATGMTYDAVLELARTMTQDIFRTNEGGIDLSGCTGSSVSTQVCTGRDMPQPKYAFGVLRPPTRSEWLIAALGLENLAWLFWYAEDLDAAKVSAADHSCLYGDTGDGDTGDGNGNGTYDGDLLAVTAGGANPIGLYRTCGLAVPLYGVPEGPANGVLKDEFIALMGSKYYTAQGRPEYNLIRTSPQNVGDSAIADPIRHNGVWLVFTLPSR